MNRKEPRAYLSEPKKNRKEFFELHTASTEGGNKPCIMRSFPISNTPKSICLRTAVFWCGPLRLDISRAVHAWGNRTPEIAGLRLAFKLKRNPNFDEIQPSLGKKVEFRQSMTFKSIRKSKISKIELSRIAFKLYGYSQYSFIVKIIVC